MCECGDNLLSQQPTTKYSNHNKNQRAGPQTACVVLSLILNPIIHRDAPPLMPRTTTQVGAVTVRDNMGTMKWTKRTITSAKRKH